MIKLLENRKCWIFDLDGTLTIPLHDFAFIRRELGIPDGEDILGHLDTLPMEESVAKQMRLDEIEREVASNSIPSPGAQELLGRLYCNGVKLAILTRNSRDVAMLTLEKIAVRQYFNQEHILGRSEAPPKPDPAGILRLMEQWDATSDDMVMVGDYLHDLKAGKAAAAMTIHVARPDGQRWPEHSDIIVDTLAEIVQMIFHDNLSGG